MTTLEIRNVHLPFVDDESASKRYTVLCADGGVEYLENDEQLDQLATKFPSHEKKEVIEGDGGLLLPS